MDDWELIQIHSEFIQNNLLHQIRCVCPELIVPVWVEEICIFLKIKNLSPAVPFGLLTVSTQVHILPKSSTINSNSLDQKPVKPPKVDYTAANDKMKTPSSLTQHSTKFLKSDCIKSNIWTRFIRLLDFLYAIIFRKSFTVWRRQGYLLKDLSDRLSCSDGSCVARLVCLDKLLKSNAMQLSPMSQEDLSHSSTALLLVNPNCSLADRSSIIVRVQTVNPPGTTQSSTPPVYLLVRISITMKVTNNSVLILAVSQQIIPKHHFNIGDRVMLIPQLCNSKLCSRLTLSVEEKTPRITCIYESAFRNFVRKTSSSDSPILVYQNMPLSLSLDAENDVEISVSIDNKSDKDAPFYLLTELLIEGVKLQIKSSRVSDNNNDKLKNRKFIGFESTFDKMKRFSESFLYSQKPASALLVGCEASGKSKLIQRLLYHLSDQPFLQTHSRVIACKSLLGKQVESLRRHLDSVMTESLWYRPCVLCLEDLDALAPRSPEVTTNPQEEFIQNLIAETIRGAILKMKRSTGPVIILATVRNLHNLHERLGGALFDEYLEVKALDKTNRSNLLRDLSLHQLQSVRNLSSLSETIESSLSGEDFDYLGGVTVCYVVGDLERLVNQTLSSLIYRHGEDRSQQFDSDSPKCMKVTLADFKMALKSFQPLAFSDLQDNSFLEKFSLNDIGGLEDVKTRLIETFVWPVKYPKLFAQSPIKLQHGALLYGPPGCGKTLTALALAKESNMKLLFVKGPELLNKHIGASESAVRELMARARTIAPAIILFDEFESLAPRRGHDSTGVTDRVVNQLLTELDGVNGLGDVFVIVTSNRPDLIDPALLRPGRIQMKIYCPLPDENAREEILNRMSDPKSLHQCLPLCKSVDISALSRNTKHFTSADLLGVVNRAGIEAMKRVDLFTNRGDSLNVSSRIESDICIKPEDIDFALRNVHPSLRQKQLEEYLTIYRDFQSTSSSKRFDSHSDPAHQAPVMKATLN